MSQHTLEQVEDTVKNLTLISTILEESDAQVLSLAINMLRDFTNTQNGFRAGWQSIETAPENQWVLACPPNGIIQIVRLDDSKSKYAWWDGAHNYKYKTFTYWMPLPTRPAEYEGYEGG